MQEKQQQQQQTCLRSFWRFNIVMKWPAQCLTCKGMRGVFLALLASRLVPLLAALWTVTWLVHHSVVALVNEEKMLRLGIWGYTANQGRGQNSSWTCWRQGSKLMVASGTLRPSLCIFIHARDQQGDCWLMHPRNQQGDTTTWACLARWGMAAAHRTRMQGDAHHCWCGEHYGRYIAGYLSESPPAPLGYSLLEG